jgi:internalin A
MEIEQKFLEIVAILQSEGGSILPLPPPATSDDIVSAEQVLGFELPDSLRRIYMVHNGELCWRKPLPEDKTFLGIFYDYPFLDLEGVIRDRDIWASVRGDVGTFFDSEIKCDPPASSKTVYSHSGWVTFAGNCLALDFAPGPAGVSGQVINFGKDDIVHFQIAKDFDSLLDGVLQSCRQRKRNSRFTGSGGWTSLVDEFMKSRSGL